MSPNRKEARDTIRKSLMAGLCSLGLRRLIGASVLVVEDSLDEVRVAVERRSCMAVRSRSVIFSQSRLVVTLVVSPSELVWMVIVVVSRMVSWMVSTTEFFTVSWTTSL